MIAISPDSVAEAREMVKKHELSIFMLSDESLEVADQFNLRHEKAIAMAKGRKMFRSLAIPTTFLVSANGLVQWIDQAEDYRVRSDAYRVLSAVEHSL